MPGHCNQLWDTGAAMPISRRAFLATGAGALAVLVVGGAAGGAIGALRDAQPEPAVPPVAPEALSRGVQREQELLQAYATAVAAHPELADRFAPIVADHAAHLDVLGREWARITEATAVPGAQPSPTPSPTPTASGSEPAGSAAPPAPGTAQDAVAALRGQEQAAAGAASADCLASAGEDESARQLAVLLGSISACETVHIGWLS